MKVQPEHYAMMRDAMRTALAEIPAGRLAAFREANTEKRFRWDLARFAHLIPFITSEIYPYADDTHVDTALRAIVRELDAHTTEVRS